MPGIPPPAGAPPPAAAATGPLAATSSVLAWCLWSQQVRGPPSAGARSVLFGHRRPVTAEYASHCSPCPSPLADTGVTLRWG